MDSVQPIGGQMPAISGESAKSAVDYMNGPQPMTDRPRLTVLGTGYLGITHAACMAHLGFEVVGVDTDSDKVARLSRGELPVFEPQLVDLLCKGIASGRLRFTTSYEEAAAFGDVHFICVGTPQRHDGNGADLG
jgi:UDPglucose 6-dehydrogenase